MGALTAAVKRSYEVPANYNEFGVADNVKIYEGMAVGSLAGYARQLVAADVFLGFAEATVDNTLTGHAAGGKNIRTRRKGSIQLDVTSLAITDIGKDVYASDANTFTLVATNNTFIGKVERYISSGVGIISFDTGN
jgi:hypothetical protein